MPLQPAGNLTQRFFVGPHPLKRWRDKINPLLDKPLESDGEIRITIESALQRPNLPADVEARDGEREALLYVCEFGGQRCTVVVVHGQKEPTVATIIPDTEQVDRRAQWNREPWRGNRSLRKLRVMRSFGFVPEECAVTLSKPVATILDHWEEADPQRKCGNCVYYGKAMSECMHHEAPVKRNRAPCSDYEPDEWEVQKDMPPKKEFTPEQIEQAVRMWNDGRRVEEIVKAVGLAKSALYRRIKSDWAHLVDTEARERAMEERKTSNTAQTNQRTKPGPGAMEAGNKALEQGVSEPLSIGQTDGQKSTQAATPVASTDTIPEPACETCIHRPVCRYQETYSEHQEWALCKWWRGEAVA